jgi:hypothetical protein
MENSLKFIKEVRTFEKNVFSKFCDILKIKENSYNWKLLYIEYRIEGVFVTGKCFEDGNGSQLEMFFSIEDLEKNENEWNLHLIEIKKWRDEQNRIKNESAEKAINAKKLENFYKLKEELLKLNLINE